jgi:hypothetical protein
LPYLMADSASISYADDVQRGGQHRLPGDLPVTVRVGVTTRPRRGHRNTFSHLALVLITLRILGHEKDRRSTALTGME